MSNQDSASEKSSIHGDLLKQLTPAWLIDATPARRTALKASSTSLPDWYRRASTEQQTAARESLHASFIAQTRLDKTMSALQDVDAFAEPLLAKALNDRFGVEADVNKTFVCLRRPLQVGDLEIEISTFEVMKLSLLQAALHNFEESECEAGAFHVQSGFVEETSTSGVFQAVTVNMTVRQFLSVCRTLDIGQQYQTYLKAFFQSAEATLRQQFIASQKAALRSAAEIALLKTDIEPKDYEMILSVIDGEIHPWQGNKQVWFRDLDVMKRRMTGCIVFSICEKYRYTDEFIVYIPHDPEHPLKRYTPSQMREVFKRRFTARDALPGDGSAPTAYQRFFSQFVAYADRPYYFGQFTRAAADAATDPLRSVWVKVAQLIPPFSTITRIKELPPERQGKREPETEPFLNPGAILRKGSAGVWADNIDPWAYLYEQNRNKVIADARSHAVPTADVDAKVRSEKLNHLLEIGLLGLNMVSMFVPVLGEIMLTVMAGQLLYESFEGAIEWSEGDRQAANAHLIDVAENLAMIAVMAGVGKGLGRLTAPKVEPLIERLEPVKRPNGETRLWKPDLSAYESDVVLDHNAIPDALGRYRVNDKTYIRQSGKVYEITFDPSLKKWRIKHPTDAQAWQPILEHNGHGAWRHTFERPLQWDRLTLLQRMGHSTQAFTDEQLLKIADGSAVNDNALRKMHVDLFPPPPELADAMRVFEADHEASIEQVDKGRNIDRLQRACPGLSRFAAQRVLLDANAEEITRLDTTRRIPLKMLEEARWYAQQGRLSRAFVDLHTGSMVSADSKWLALHALEKLPGWSAQVRLEIRAGRVDGPLIDAIGSDTAASRKYLVKNGPAYQALDERGEALNSVSGTGDNFFASIMHALPDESREALGVPHVGQSSDLQKAVIDSAIEHRTELAQRLVKRTGSNRFKPPVRVSERTVGYYASGRGQGLNPSLTTRVQDVYPGLNDQQANGFILNQVRAGKTDAQIYTFLQARLREWEALESTLDHWVGEEPASESILPSMLGGKFAVARNIKECWRNSPLADEHARFRWLDLICDDPLPPLAADFSHVRELNLRGRFITDASINAVLEYFPEIEGLGINATGGGFTNVPQKLGGMQRLTRLSLYCAEPFSAQMPTQLNTLTNLEELSVYSPGYTPISFDLSPLRNLRKLGISAMGMLEWPAGVLDLPKLERLNLKSTGISQLPRAMYEGHERLWSGLSLEWSNFSREHFKPAYEYVKNHPQHLVDLEEMVRGYAEAELVRLGQGAGGAFYEVSASFFRQWQGAKARFEAVDALSEQHHMLDLQLNQWAGQAMQAGLDVDQIIKRSMATISLRNCWRDGAFKRYAATADASVLELPNLQLRTFPELPSGAFAHVQALYLSGTRATAEQLQGFVRGFTELKTLDLSASGLTEVPIAPGSLSKLTRLDLSGNQIGGGPAIQRIFDGLSALELLDLSNNPLNALDVRGMSRLKALNLRATDLHEWPSGAQDLPHLHWLDLRDSKISSLPEAVLEQDVLINTDLNGLPLTPQSVTALKATRQRIETARGLPAGTLEKFALEPIASTFPPSESGHSIFRHLLPLPEAPVGEGPAHFAQRLQRVKPSLADADALQVIEQMREGGGTEFQINERIAGWEQTFETLTRRLNGWLFIRESRGAGWIVSSESRGLGALRILECWREGLTAANDVADSVLNLNGLQLGDLPEMPAEFSHVGTLNLTGTRLSAQGADDFLKAFTQLKTLQLNGNDLEALPEQIQYMGKLERLELAANQLSDADPLYASLNRLERLTWLDLGYNELDAFDAGVFERLETLDLRNNNLTDWPEGVLDALNLRTLHLSSNDISSIPSLAFDGNHEELMAGTDLADNFNLSHESLERLRTYRERTGRDTVLGFSRSDLDELLDEASGEGASESESESFESDEILPDVEPDSGLRAPWLANASPEETISKTQVWNQLAAEPDNAAFFHLLSRLQDTQEFRVANADLTRRVWTVIEAAASNSELRETLFASSNTHGTCVDGRILTFSGLEGKVFTHNALLDVPVGRLSVKGPALLKLSRQLFRLDKVDDLATKAARHAGQDQTEVRLGYRIGLTGGWSDGLELPGQPKHMTYASGVTRGQLEEVRLTVVNAERGDGFFEDLIQRDYWVDYLKEKYPDVFRALDEAEVGEAIEDDATSPDDPAFLSQLFDQAAARNARLIELSRKEVADIESTASGAGPSMTV
jgi:Leucine-rich repeat (LRR) protein